MHDLRTYTARQINILGVRCLLSEFIVFASFLLCMVLVYGALTWTGGLNEFGGDSAAYLLISRVYSPYHAASAATTAFKSQIISPPLFPFLLALIDGGYHFLLAHLLVGAFACAAAVTLFFWLRKEGIPLVQSAVIAMMWACAPANLMQVFNIWTEYPYIFCSLVVILAMSTVGQSDTQKKWILAAVFVACACLIRVAALPLLCAFLLFLAIKRPRKAIVFAAIALVPFALWAAYSGHSEQGGGSYVKQISDMYGTNLLDRLGHQIAAEYDAIKNQWEIAWLGPFASEMPKQFVWGFWWLCIAGWIWRLSRLRFDALYLGLYLLQLFAWAHPEEASRYALVIYPVLTASGFLLLYFVASKLRQAVLATYLPVIVVAMLIIVMAPNLIFVANHFVESDTDDALFARHAEYWYTKNQPYALSIAQFQRKLLEHLNDVSKYVPADACVFAIKPTIVSLYVDRPSFGPPPSASDASSFDSEIRRCHFAYVLAFRSPSYSEEFYPLNRLGEKAKVISTFSYDRNRLGGALIEIR